MARRSTPERLIQAKRSATLERLVSAGMLRSRAEAALAAWEGAQDGLLDWEGAWRTLRPQPALSGVHQLGSNSLDPRKFDRDH